MDEWIEDKDKKQVIWRVLLPPGENLWMVGGQAVKLQHATTGKILTVTRCCSFSFVNIFHRIFSSNVYSESLGEGMHEVVAGDPKGKEGTQWAINFFQLPDSGRLCEHGHVHLY